MTPVEVQVPEPHVIEEVEKYHPLEQEQPLQLPLPVPEIQPEPKKQGGAVIVIEL
jgi:hypothetical protein